MSNRQETHFRRLLKYVWHQSRFYKDYYSAHGIGERDLAEISIQDLPLLTKQTLMDNFDEAVTDARLRRLELEHWCHRMVYPQQNFCKEFVIVRSSGTSGYQGTFVYHKTTWRAADLTISHYLPVPENYPGTTRVAWYIDSYGHHAADLAAAVRMPRGTYETLIIPLLEDPNRIVTRLNRFQPHRLFGYSSCISVLAELALEKRLNIRPKGIFISGDLLTEGMRDKIRTAWHAPVFEIYAASEALYIALRDCTQDEMEVVQELNVVEVLNERDCAVSSGEHGRVILTNLCNYVLPVLRYELGDYVQLGTARNDFRGAAATIQSLKGRVNDALPVVLNNGKHDFIHPLVLPIYIPGLVKIQFISTRPDRVRIDYIATTNLDSLIREEFQHILNIKGATKTLFSVRRVSHIPNDPQSGKFRLIRLDGGHTERLTPVLTTDRGEETTPVPTLIAARPFTRFGKHDVEQAIPNRFEHIVRKYPTQLALKTDITSSTYDELNRAANRVAHAILAARGLRTEPIALQMDNSAELIAAILGVLKAGKFYVYLDPSYPAKRTAEILSDAQPGLVLTTTRSLRLEQCEWTGAQYIYSDQVDPSLSQENPAIPIASDALAWLLYTSGSTGRPKGVVHNHRNLLHNVMTYTNSLHISTDDRLTLLHSCGVITSIKNLFGALLNGAAIYPFNVRQHGLQRLISSMIQNQITIYHSVPSVFRTLTDALTRNEHFPTLRVIALGSEPVTRRDVQQYKQYFSEHCVLLNLLGNTEMGTYRHYFIEKTTSITSSIVPAGYAVEDKEVCLLGEDGRPVGFNERGEIAVTSPYLAVGYWRAPAATHGSVGSDAKEGGRRTYLTGDIGRMTADGCLTYLGRKDFIVKIRGNRVDLGEVETTLLDYPAIKEAIVVTCEGPTTEEQLIAYLVQNAGDRASNDTLRQFMESRLPEYMVPTTFVFLEILPRMADGKIDRQALSQLKNTGPQAKGVFAAPRNALEEQIASIWAEVLKLERVGINEDFFDLGGHSLLAAQVMTRVRNIFDVDLPFGSLLAEPTVANMAAVIVQHNVDAAEREELRDALKGLNELSEYDTRRILVDIIEKAKT